MQVEARGSSVLLVREIQSQNLINIITNWSIHPVLGAYIKVREWHEEDAADDDDPGRRLPRSSAKLR
jgi:hypothetical protein